MLLIQIFKKIIKIKIRKLVMAVKNWPKDNRNCLKKKMKKLLSYKKNRSYRNQLIVKNKMKKMKK